MADFHGDFPTIIGPDARIKGEISFDKALRIEGGFEGQIRSKGTLSIAEGAKVVADIDAANVKLEGECKGNLNVTEKLQLMATARMEGDLRATRLEIADGAIFIGNVTVGSSDASRRPAAQGTDGSNAPREASRSMPAQAQPQMPRPRPQEPTPAAAPGA